MIDKNNMSWGVVIVTYNPNVENLVNKINIISKLTDNLVVVNNGSDLDLDGDFLVINLGRNEGIAKAQNIGVKKLNTKFIFFFDQDSEIEESFFELMMDKWKKIENTDTKIGALSPCVIDKNLGSKQPVLIFLTNRIYKVNWSKDDQILKKTFPISSGMLVSMDAYVKSGGQNNKLFIDCVDYEFNLKLMQSGYNIYSTNAANIYHAIGVKKERRLLTKKIYPYNYPLFREYYFVRNSIYVLLKFRKSFKGITRLILKGILIRIIFIGYEEKKIDRIKIMIKGFLDGFRLFKNEIDNVR